MISTTPPSAAPGRGRPGLLYEQRTSLAPRRLLNIVASRRTPYPTDDSFSSELTIRSGRVFAYSFLFSQGTLPMKISIYSMFRRTTAVAGIALLSVLPLPAPTTPLPTIDWVGGSGNFGVLSNWNPDTIVPTDEYRAVFNPVGQITVTLDQTRSVGSFQTFGTADGTIQPQVTFDLNEFTLNLVSAKVNVSNRSFTMRGLTSRQSTFIFENGTVNSNQFFIQAVSNELPIYVYLRNGATLKSNTTVEIAGSQLFVQANSTLDTSGLRMSTGGTLSVSGVNSKLQSPLDVTHFLGTGGQNGLLHITNSGQADLGRINLGRTSVSSGNDSVGSASILVEGATTSFKAAQLNIAGGVNTSGGNLVSSTGENSVATFRNGTTAEIGLLRNLEQGTLVIDGASVSVGAGGATLYAGSTMNMVVHSAATAMLATENLTITNSVLNVSFEDSFMPILGQIIPLVEYTALTGFFAGINQGGTLTIGDTMVSFDYGSGSNDMISLTVIPEPSTAAIVGMICLLAAIRVRGRTRITESNSSHR